MTVSAHATGRRENADAAPGYAPTGEQQAIIDAYKAARMRIWKASRSERPGQVEGLVINAYAGSGKTTILKLLAAAAPRVAFLYLAYNATARKDAAKSFPRNAKCYTTHGLATQPMSHMFDRIKTGPKRMRAYDLAVAMGITFPARLTDSKMLAPGQVAMIVKATVLSFCYSASEAIDGSHLPAKLARRFSDDEMAALRKLIPPIAQRVWDEDITQAEGKLPMVHDYYLKAFALTHPRLPGDVIALDEAQDSNKCVEAMILEQLRCGTEGCPGYGREDCTVFRHVKHVIMTGDTYQALYGWRGATDAMASFAAYPGVQVLSITQSFRYGPAIAGQGNKLLTMLGAPKELRGFDQIPSRVMKIPGANAVPDAVICKTNAEAFRRAIGYLAMGFKVAFPKGAGEIAALVRGVKDLKEGRPSEHADLIGFENYKQLQQFVQDEGDDADPELRRLVDLVDEYETPDALLALLDQIGDESKGFKADVVITTGHGSKGREWRLVLIADDFMPPKKRPGRRPEMPRDLAMLLYVALTRAQYVLDCEAVSWIDDYLAAYLARPEPGEALAEEIEAELARIAAQPFADAGEMDMAIPAVARAMALGQI